jgi:hypothetical protein
LAVVSSFNVCNRAPSGRRLRVARTEASNVFNLVSLGALNANLSSATVGTITGASGPYCGPGTVFSQKSVKHFLDVLDELNRLQIEFVSFRENIDQHESVCWFRAGSNNPREEVSLASRTNRS